MKVTYSYDEPWWIPVPVCVLQKGYVYTTAHVYLRIRNDKYFGKERFTQVYLNPDDTHTFCGKHANETKWDDYWSFRDIMTKENRIAVILL